MIIFRTYRKRCFGRLKKHTGDLCLQAGLPAEALLHYQTSAETLRGIHDWLWLAGMIYTRLEEGGGVVVSMDSFISVID